MGLMSFIKEAGQKLFGHTDPAAAAQQAQAEPDNSELLAKVAEANRPMLSHPDKIYPGQMLRIPA